MKFWLLLGGIVFAMVAMGIIHFQRDDGQIKISIDEARLKQTSKKLIDRGEEFIDNTRKSADRGQDSAYDDDSRYESEARSRSQRFRASPSQR